MRIYVPIVNIGMCSVVLLTVWNGLRVREELESALLRRYPSVSFVTI